jgi:dolichol-phosphate mannosyltransferase
MKIRSFRFVFALMQMLLMLDVVRRLCATARGERIRPATPVNQPAETGRLTLLVPVLNEYQRLAPCLTGLMAQGSAVAEILVVDGGSCDGTQDLVALFMQRDSRVRLLDASPLPAGWNGKSWGLHVGFQQIAPTSEWVLTLDADVRPTALLATSLLMHADKTGLSALSVATLQEIEGVGQGLLHPALLTTLIYRFGIPGHAIRKVQAVQANGQCFLCRRTLLERCGDFSVAQSSLCEDVTLARALVAAGHPVGFYEADDLVSVAMYQNWRELWQNWTRSLPMHDRFAGKHTVYNWLTLLLVQALPLPLLLYLMLSRSRDWKLILLNACAVMLRLGVLFGTARAYRRLPWSYWLSPLCDLPVVVKLGISGLQRRHTWRGRTLVRGGLV